MMKDIKTRISKLNIDFEAYWEPIYLILLAFFVGMRFLLSTMFTIYWPKYFYRTLTVIGVVLVLLHLMMAKDISKKEIAAMLVVTFVFMMSHYVSGYDFLVDLLILILGAYRVNFRNILKTYIAVWSVLLVVTIIGAMTGLAENLVYYQGEGGERVRMALGICYPTDLAAYVVFLMFAYVCVRDEYITYLEIGVMAVLAGAVYYITDARTDFIIMVLLVILVFVHKKFANLFFEIIEKRITKIVLMLFPIIICIVAWTLTMLYQWDRSFMVNLDGKLSGRLAIGKQAIDNCGISLFGKYIFEKGAGGSVENDEMYFFIDSSYISMGIKYGIVLLIFIVSAMILQIYIKYKEKKYIQIIIIIVLLTQSLMEHHLIQYWYNPWVICYLTSFLGTLNDYEIKKKKNQVLDLN